MTTNGHSRPKTMYIPDMCDHAYILGAALRAQGLPIEILPPSDDDSLAIGLDLCKGRECLPCVITTGDIIRRARQPDFDPARSVLLMATTMGPCRFGQYEALQRDILDEKGLSDLEIISPNASNSYQEFGDNPVKLRQLVWQGVVAVDLLQKLRHEYRPYEVNPGQTDQLYADCLSLVVEAVEAGGGKELVKSMEWTAEQFENLPVDRSEPRPVIGLVGEIYLRFNTYGNQDIIRKVEAAGGQVILASMMEWFYYINWSFKNYTRHFGHYLAYFQITLVDFYQQYMESKLVKRVEHLLQYPHETPVANITQKIKPYYEPFLATEAVLSMGKAIDFAEHSLSGILHIMPFSCMPGIITAGMAPRIRADLDNIPWLDIIYDAQGGTNINTRLEAFMYQATQYKRRKEGERLSAVHKQGYRKY